MVKNRDRQPGVYSIHEAKTQLSRLLDQVLSTGQPAMIGRRGKAEVMLASIPSDTAAKRLPGLYRSTIKIADELPASPLGAIEAKGLLLSPQTLIRWLAAPFELPGPTHEALTDPARDILVSVDALRQVLVWQSEGLVALGQLKGRLASACTAQGFEVLSIEPSTIEKAASLDGDVDAALAVLLDLDRV